MEQKRIVGWNTMEKEHYVTQRHTMEHREDLGTAWIDTRAQYLIMREAVGHTRGTCKAGFSTQVPVS